MLRKRCQRAAQLLRKCCETSQCLSKVRRKCGQGFCGISQRIAKLLRKCCESAEKMLRKCCEKAAKVCCEKVFCCSYCCTKFCWNRCHFRAVVCCDVCVFLCFICFSMCFYVLSLRFWCPWEDFSRAKALTCERISLVLARILSRTSPPKI